MTYNFSGILYEMFTAGGLIVLLGVFFVIIGLISSKKQTVQPNDISNAKRLVTLGSIVLLIALFFFVHYLYIIINPSIKTYDGAYGYSDKPSYRGKARILSSISLSREHHFSSYRNGEVIFNLDAVSAEKIFHGELKCGKLYRVYYEERCNIIVGIEELSFEEYNANLDL